jgi:hypothetical protein
VSTDVFGDLREWKQVLEHLEYLKNLQRLNPRLLSSTFRASKSSWASAPPTANQHHTAFSSISTLC